MRAALLAAVAVCCLASEARASVTYSLVNQVYDAYTTSVGHLLNLSFTISDAAVARGTFRVQNQQPGRSTGPDPMFSGDVADFISFTTSDETDKEIVNRDFAPGYLSLSATFDSLGAITSFSEMFGGQHISSNLSGDGRSVSGSFSSDRYNLACLNNTCRVSGQLVAVPEPASLALLALGGFLAARSRRRA